MTHTTIPTNQTHPTARAQTPRRLLIAAGCVAALIALGWLGATIAPAPFPAIAQSAPPPTIPLPSGLPAPVERFYRQQYGERIPQIKSAIISGRGTMRIAPLFNITLPVRFRFIHDTGRSYRHYIEVTFFGLPLLKVNEYYVNGKERQELPWAVATDNPKLDQAGNLGMWAEILQWLPAALITDPQVRWEAIDDESAFLIVPASGDKPSGAGAAPNGRPSNIERFLVRFDPSGKIQYWEVMRHASGDGEKTLWINGTWFDDGSPWFIIHEQEIAANVAVDTSLTTKGP